MLSNHSSTFNEKTLIMKKLIVTICVLLSIVTSYAQVQDTLDKFETVYKDENVTFRKLGNKTWLGTGNVMSNESLYLFEGEELSLLIDAGTTIPKLDSIVSTITEKPVILALTHVHPDHAGAVGCFDEVWINAADTVNIPKFMPDYKGEIRFMGNGHTFDLGGRKIEVLETPGHTPGSVTFLEKGSNIGYCGDAFGTAGGILVFTDLDKIIETCRTTYSFLKENGYDTLYCGHFYCETLSILKD